MEDADRCPVCGIQYDDLPIGHCLMTPADGSSPSCEVLPPPPPDIVDQWLGRA